jgi:phospholipid-binding lipoprotein MlaA
MKRPLMIVTLLSLFLTNILVAQANDQKITSTKETRLEQETTIADPLESVNRVIFRFNHGLDEVLIRPIIIGYQKAVPVYGQDRIRHFIRNLLTPLTLLHSLLQGDIHNAFTSFWRFVLNTTFGLGGLYDFATEQGLVMHNEDMGQTLAHYNIGHGIYIVLPLIGPSSLRDGVGRISDSFTNPLRFAIGEDEYLAASLSHAFQLRSDSESFIQRIQQSSLDSYATFRSLYVQHRNNVVKNR